jgi:hypothetical protein
MKSPRFLEKHSPFFQITHPEFTSTYKVKDAVTTRRLPDTEETLNDAEYQV